MNKLSITDSVAAFHYFNLTDSTAIQNLSAYLHISPPDSSIYFALSINSWSVNARENLTME
jgi:hypothetical protein